MTADAVGASPLEAIRRHVLVVVLVFVLVAGTGFAALSTQKAEYRARSTIILLPKPQGGITYEDTVRNLLPTLAQILRAETFFEDHVVGKLSFPMSAPSARDAVSTEVSTNAGALTVVGKSRQPARAQELSTVSAGALVSYLSDNGAIDLRQTDVATLPDQPDLPRSTTSELAVLIAAAVLALTAAILFERLFPRIRTASEVAAATHLPVLGQLPSAPQLRKAPRLFVGRPGLANVEDATRDLRTNLVFSMRQRRARTLLLTSVEERCGKSTLAANLSVLFTEAGYSVLLIDADPERPVQHKLFRLSNDRGLSSATIKAPLHARRADLVESVIQATEFANLSVVTSGPLNVDRRATASSHDFALSLGENADLVVIDGPAMGGRFDARALAAKADATLLVGRAGRLPPASWRAASTSLGLVDAKVLGVALTMVSRAEPLAFGGEPSAPAERIGADEPSQ